MYRWPPRYLFPKPMPKGSIHKWRDTSDWFRPEPIYAKDGSTYHWWDAEYYFNGRRCPVPDEYRYVEHFRDVKKEMEKRKCVNIDGLHMNGDGTRGVFVYSCPDLLDVREGLDSIVAIITSDAKAWRFRPKVYYATRRDTSTDIDE